MRSFENFVPVYSVQFNLPEWLQREIVDGRVPRQLPTVEAQMAYAIWLSRRNAEERTGGPFGALVVETESGLVKGVGVNRVVPCCNPLLHGEGVAIAMATTAMQTYDLGAEDMPAHSLVTSAQPCAMCNGLIPWSGVRTLVIGATAQDTEELTGFDEGPIHPDWASELEAREIAVIQGVLRGDARAALQWYRDNGGYIYNGRKGRK